MEGMPCARVFACKLAAVGHLSRSVRVRAQVRDGNSYRVQVRVRVKVRVKVHDRFNTVFAAVHSS